MTIFFLYECDCDYIFCTLLNKKLNFHITIQLCFKKLNIFNNLFYKVNILQSYNNIQENNIHKLGTSIIQIITSLTF